MGHRYGKLPHELLSVDLDSFILNFSVYLFARGEEGFDHAWEKANEPRREEE